MHEKSQLGLTIENAQTYKTAKLPLSMLLYKRSPDGATNELPTL